MNKVHGKKSDFAPISEDATRVVINYGYQEVDEEDATWYEVAKYKKQTSQLSLSDVKEAIIADINERTREKIVSGFVHDSEPIWLSEENQLNLATGLAPFEMKVGETEDGKPVMKEFKTAKELSAFWQACAAWRQQCLAEGYAEKEAIDWSQYEGLFPQGEGEASQGE